MFRSSLLLTPLFSLVLLAGCGGAEKELPTDIASPSEKVPEEVTTPVPAASDPAAVKFVQARIAAATDGHPERLEKLKVNRLRESGRQLQGTTLVPISRKIAAVWPDRFLFVDETNTNGPNKLSIGLKQLVLSFRRNDEPFDPGMPKGYEQVLHVDSIGLHWLHTLVPLVDSKTILFDAKKQSIGATTWDTVQVAIPSCPTFTLWFDEKTNLLNFVTYVHVEGGVSRLNKRLGLAGHKAFAGVMLPTLIEFERNVVSVESWTVSAWEFPDQIPDAEFEQKK